MMSLVSYQWIELSILTNRCPRLQVRDVFWKVCLSGNMWQRDLGGKRGLFGNHSHAFKACIPLGENQFCRSAGRCSEVGLRLKVIAFRFLPERENESDRPVYSWK